MATSGDQKKLEGKNGSFIRTNCVAFPRSQGIGKTWLQELLVEHLDPAIILLFSGVPTFARTCKLVCSVTTYQTVGSHTTDDYNMTAQTYLTSITVYSHQHTSKLYSQLYSKFTFKTSNQSLFSITTPENGRPDAILAIWHVTGTPQLDMHR